MLARIYNRGDVIAGDPMACFKLSQHTVRMVSAILLLCGAAATAHSQPAQPIEPALESQPIPETGQEAGGEQGEGAASQEEAEPNRLLPAIEAIESAIRELVTEEDAQQHERQDERDEADLDAQKEMALWAKHMTRATVAGVIITFAGVCLVAGTLYYSKIAAAAAVKAAEEAKHIVAVTRDLGIRQVRAYVDISTVIIKDLEVGKNPTTTVRVRNRGQSPAHRVRMTTRLNMNVPEKARRISLLKTSHDGLVSVATLSAGDNPMDSIIRCEINITQPILDAVMNGDRLLVVGCYISYYDVFLKFRRTTGKFVVDIATIEKGVGRFRPDHKGNRST